MPNQIFLNHKINCLIFIFLNQLVVLLQTFLCLILSNSRTFIYGNEGKFSFNRKLIDLHNAV